MQPPAPRHGQTLLMKPGQKQIGSNHTHDAVKHEAWAPDVQRLLCWSQITYWLIGAAIGFKDIRLIDGTVNRQSTA